MMLVVVLMLVIVLVVILWVSWWMWLMNSRFYGLSVLVVK